MVIIDQLPPGPIAAQPPAAKGRVRARAFAPLAAACGPDCPYPIERNRRALDKVVSTGQFRRGGSGAKGPRGFVRGSIYTELSNLMPRG